ncbi:hypothetical protein RUND412_008920 [Rhizina undulata]
MSINTYIQNLILFSPLLFLAILILLIYDNASKLRRGAGLEPEPTGPPVSEEENSEESQYQDPPESPPIDPSLLDETIEQGPSEGSDSDGAESEAEGSGVGNPRPGPSTPRSRIVGTKKARSLARRDQRRAYHEFLHSQRAQRQSAEEALRDAEEERLFEEKRRRALIEDEIAAKREKERLARIERERIAEEERKKDVEILVKMVEGGKVKVEDIIAALEGRRSDAWVREMLRNQGLLGVKKGWIGMVTGEGWYVKVGEKELGVLWKELEANGRMSWKEFGAILEAEMA